MLTRALGKVSSHPQNTRFAPACKNKMQPRKNFSVLGSCSVEQARTPRPHLPAVLNSALCLAVIPVLGAVRVNLQGIPLPPL